MKTNLLRSIGFSLFLFLLIPQICWGQLSFSDIELNATRKLYVTKLGVDNDDVEIGDGKSLTNLNPQVKLFRWNKENSLSIKFTGLKAPATFDSQTKTLEIKNNKMGFYFNRADDTNLKFGLIFYEKPVVNTWDFQLEGWEDFGFHYQHPLANVNSDGSTWEETPNGIRSDRPVDVVGSYAIYHKTKRDHRVGEINYRTGKFGHFYRPKFIDANGKWVWGSLHIEKGIYTVSVPQNFLDSAVYPVKANDNFGEEGVGGSTHTGGLNIWWGQHGIPVLSGTGVDIHHYGRTAIGGAYFKGMLTFDSDDTIVPNGVGSEVAINNVAGWRISTFGTAPDIVASTVYYVGVLLSGSIRVYYDTDNTPDVDESCYDEANNYNTPEDVVVTGDLQEFTSIYCTYTPSGAPPAAVDDSQVFIISKLNVR